MILRRLYSLHRQEMGRRAKAMALARVAVAADHHCLRNQGGRIKLELGVQGEAFYYFGHRAAKCIQYAVANGKFGPAGVRDVRNSLIEHPKALHWDFQYHQPRGIVMKPFRTAGDLGVDGLKDAGLFINASEFSRELIEFIDRRGPSRR
jgi:hypothetical protein